MRRQEVKGVRRQRKQEGEEKGSLTPVQKDGLYTCLRYGQIPNLEKLHHNLLVKRFQLSVFFLPEITKNGIEKLAS